MPDEIANLFTDAAQPVQTPAPAQQPPSPTATEPVQVPVSPPPQEDWREYAQQLGYDLAEVKSPKELIDRVHAQSREAAARQYYQPQQQVEPEPEPEPEDYWGKTWGAPDFDPEWLAVLETDPDTGDFVPKMTSKGLPLATNQIVDSANRFRSWYNTSTRQYFQDNPYKQTYEKIKEPILNDVRSLVEEMVNQQFSQRDQQRAVNDFETEHFKRIYVLDGQGRAQVGVNQQPVLTTWGTKLLENINRLKATGADPNQKTTLDLAMQLTGEEEPVKPTKKQSQPDTKAQSFLQGALEKATESAGYGGFHTPTPGDADYQTDGEVENAFIQAAARAAATTS